MRNFPFVSVAIGLAILGSGCASAPPPASVEAAAAAGSEARPGDVAALSLQLAALAARGEACPATEAEDLWKRGARLSLESPISSAPGWMAAFCGDYLRRSLRETSAGAPEDAATRAHAQAVGARGLLLAYVTEGFRADPPGTAIRRARALEPVLADAHGRAVAFCRKGAEESPPCQAARLYRTLGADLRARVKIVAAGDKATAFTKEWRAFTGGLTKRFAK